MSDIILTITGFKKYETVTALGFLCIAIMFIFNGQYFAVLSPSLAIVWVFTSSGYRQSVDDLIKAINDK